MMSPIPTRLLAVTAVTVVFALNLFMASTATSGKNTYVKLATWQNIEPATAAAISEFEIIGTDDRKPDAGRIKVGYPYKLEHYGISAFVKWTSDMFWNPERAAAKRVFEVYNVSKMNSNDWAVLREAYASNPVMMAFITIENKNFVGTPVKWNKNIANVMMNAFSIVEKSDDPNSTAVSLVAAEIIDLAALKSAVSHDPNSLVSRMYPIDPKPQSRELMGAVRKYANGNIDVLTAMGPSRHIYFGFSETPDDFKLKLLYRLITTEGALGQPLGKVMPSWPSKDD